MLSLSLVISGAPVPCPRPRIVCKPFPNAYYPKAYKEYQKRAALALREQLGSRPALDGAVIVEACFYVQRPKSTKLSHPNGDIDNYAKAALDACTAAGVWKDDKQVIRLIATKVWRTGQFSARTTLDIFYEEDSVESI